VDYYLFIMVVVFIMLERLEKRPEATRGDSGSISPSNLR
jgi:hypothetical protein